MVDSNEKTTNLLLAGDSTLIADRYANLTPGTVPLRNSNHQVFLLLNPVQSL